VPVPIRSPWPGGLVWPFVAGLVLIAAGIGLRAWSIATLGRFFESLGSEDADFAAGRKRLIPGVW
jgi:hypothetical protein